MPQEHNIKCNTERNIHETNNDVNKVSQQVWDYTHNDYASRSYLTGTALKINPNYYHGGEA